MTEFNPPCSLSNVSDEQCEQFECTVQTLNDWLINHARNNEKNGASRTFVITTKTGAIAGYFCLSTAGITHCETKAALRNMPNPIPVLLLGRLAVDKKYTGRCVGQSMLQAAIRFSQEVSKTIGVFAIITHPINESARNFYLKHGFEEVKSDKPLFLLYNIRKKVTEA